MTVKSHLMTTVRPSTLPVARVRVSAAVCSFAAPSARALAVGLVVGGGETVAWTQQVQTQGLRTQEQGINGFVVRDYPAKAMKPVGGVRGVPPRGRPV